MPITSLSPSVTPFLTQYKGLCIMAPLVSASDVTADCLMQKAHKMGNASSFDWLNSTGFLVDVCVALMVCLEIKAKSNPLMEEKKT